MDFCGCSCRSPIRVNPCCLQHQSKAPCGLRPMTGHELLKRQSSRDCNARLRTGMPSCQTFAEYIQQSEVRRILRATGAQAKLSIGQPGDRYEQEADRVAEKVMRMPDAEVAQRVESGTVQPMRIQRACPACENEPQRQPEEEEEQLQTKEAPGQTPQVGSGVEARINSLKSGGSPLDQATRSIFEPVSG